MRDWSQNLSIYIITFLASVAVAKSFLYLHKSDISIITALYTSPYQVSPQKDLYKNYW